MTRCAPLAAVAAALLLSGVPVPTPAQDSPPLEALRRRFEAAESRFRSDRSADPARCGNGFLVDAGTAEALAAELLAADDGTIDAWFRLALDPAVLPSNEPVRRWASATLARAAIGVVEAKAPTERAFVVFSARTAILREVLRRRNEGGEAAWADGATEPPLHLIGLLGDLAALPELLAIPPSARELRAEPVAQAVEAISGRAIRNGDGGTYPSGTARLESFRAFYGTRSASPLGAILDAAERLELDRSRFGAWHWARRFADPVAVAGIKSEKLRALLERRWPAPSLTHEGQDADEPLVAGRFSEIRDAAFLALFRRDPKAALASLGRGLELNRAVVGQSLLPETLGFWADKARLFASEIDASLEAALTERVRDRKLSPLTRVKWLVIRDQWFRPAAGAQVTMTLVEPPTWARARPTATHELQWFRAGATSASSEGQGTLPAGDREFSEFLRRRGF